MEQFVIGVLLVWIITMGGLLIWMRDYKECLIGGVGLVVIIIASSVTVWDMYYGTVYYGFLPASFAILAGIALVITQHVLGHFKHWWKNGRKSGSKLFY